MIEGNDVASKFKIDGGGSPKKVLVVIKSLFKSFIDIRSSVKASLPIKISLVKREFLYNDYCEWKCQEGIEPEKLILSN